MKIDTQHEIVVLHNDQVRETVKFWVSEGWVDEDWIPSVRIDFLVYRSRSRGGRGSYGKDFISMETSRFLNEAVDSFEEYPRFAQDPEIGSVFGDRERAIRTRVIHEMCHALQYSKYRRKVAEKLGITKGFNGHKEFWRAIYRLTRRALVNPKDTPQFNPGVKPKVEKPHTSPLPPLKRAEATEVIAKMFSEGKTAKEIIEFLTTQHGMKKSTAAVYVSQAGPGAGSRPRKAKIKKSNLNEFGIVCGQ